jgi:hypothetical protein
MAPSFLSHPPVTVYPNFISESEAQSIVNEIEPLLARKKYLSSHWDHVVVNYREIEKAQWTADTLPTIRKIAYFILSQRGELFSLSLFFPLFQRYSAFSHIISKNASISSAH